MSDSEGDFSDELLELAGAGLGEKKRRKRQDQHKSAKRKKHDVSGSESESGGDVPDSAEDSNPYPLEGRYIDEEDRERLLGMAEIEREDILAQRQEKMQRIVDKRNLDQMLRERTGANDETGVSKAAKRNHTQRGATKEKSRKLDELKAKRKAKDEKKRTRTDSPRRDRSSSPMDMGSSDEEEEDGQVTKYDEEEEQDRKYFSKTPAEDEGPLTVSDLEHIRVTRDAVIKHCFSPWFTEFITGAWVRYLVGADKQGVSVYRVCEVVEVSKDTEYPYKVNDQLVDYELKLRYGTAEKKFQMDKISNAPFTDHEFDRLVRTCATDKIKLPSKAAVKKKQTQMTKHLETPLTESDINSIVARKAEVHAKTKSGPSGNAFISEKGRLMQARQLAAKRGDDTEVEQIDAKLAQLMADANRPTRHTKTEDRADILARVNERNRKANQEAIRKAEHLEAERRRRERKLASANGTATPPTDRLRASRPGTPGTPMLKTALATPRDLTPLPSLTTLDDSKEPKPAKPDASFEASVLDSVEIDLGDF